MVTTIFALVGLALVAAPGQPPPVDDAFAGVTSPKDVHIAVMNATVVMWLQGPETSSRTTGFFVWKKGADGRQRVFLVTAAHAFEDVKPGRTLLIVARHKNGRGKCESDRWNFDIFDREDNPLWLKNKDADIAVLEIGGNRLPCVAISVSDLATMAGVGFVELGDEVFTVGYPSDVGSSSYPEGYYAFLRFGRVAGYPVASTRYSPTGIYFDASVSAGYSGAPVYWFRGSGEGSSSPGTVKPRAMVVGVVNRVLEGPDKGDGKRANLALGYASLAAYARELIEKAK
jgi:hypothetical protein